MDASSERRDTTQRANTFEPWKIYTNFCFYRRRSRILDTTLLKGEPKVEWKEKKGEELRSEQRTNPWNIIIMLPHASMHTSALNFSARAPLHRRYYRPNSLPACAFRERTMHARDRYVLHMHAGRKIRVKTIRGPPTSKKFDDQMCFFRSCLNERAFFVDYAPWK